MLKLEDASDSLKKLFAAASAHSETMYVGKPDDYECRSTFLFYEPDGVLRIVPAPDIDSREFMMVTAMYMKVRGIADYAGLFEGYRTRVAIEDGKVAPQEGQVRIEVLQVFAASDREEDFVHADREVKRFWGGQPRLGPEEFPDQDFKSPLTRLTAGAPDIDEDEKELVIKTFNEMLKLNVDDGAIKPN